MRTTELEDRVDRLERENRRLKAGGGLVLLLVGFIFLLGQASPGVKDEINARSISIYDENERLSATLTSEHLRFYDENEKVRASLTSEFLALLDETGKVGAGLGSEALIFSGENGEEGSTLNSGALVFGDENGKARAGLTLGGLAVSDENEIIRVVLNFLGLEIYDDENEKERFLLSSEMLAFRDENEKIRTRLTPVGLSISDESGTARAGLGFTEKHDGVALSLNAANGGPLANLFTGPEGVGLDLHDADGARGAGLMVQPESSGVVFYDVKGKARVGLGFSADTGYSMLHFQDDNGKIQMLLDNRRGPGLDFRDANGNTRAKLDVMGLRFRNGDDKVHLSLTSLDNGASIILGDSNGTPRIGMLQMPGYAPRLSFRDADGEALEEKVIFAQE